MNIKKKALKTIEKMTGTHILRTMPRGVDPFYDLFHYVPHLRMNVIFDIGANIGQSCRDYIEKAPESHIYCFEPVERTFSMLTKNFRDYEKIHSYKLAFGAVRGRGRMRLEGPSEMFFLENPTVDSAGGENVEEIDIDTVDHFCAEINIGRINYFKVDTEGGDLDVLLGAKDMLQGQFIDVVEVEAGMNPRNQRHVRFEILKSFLESNSYFLFGIYQQIHEWPSEEPQLRRVNATFISSDVIRSYVVRKR
jgi:FkbM family methyltransferase